MHQAKHAADCIAVIAKLTHHGRRAVRVLALINAEAPTRHGPYRSDKECSDGEKMAFSPDPPIATALHGA